MPAVLGVLAACCVRSSNAGMERLAWPRLARARLALVATVCVAQYTLVAGALVAAQPLLEPAVSWDKQVLLLTSLSVWQGLCLASVALLRGAWMWLPPCAVLGVVVAFAYNADQTPRWWNPVLTLSTVTVVAGALVLAAGLVAVAVTADRGSASLS